ncbi:DNA-3-methyladenine glycosylase family protein [Prosthecomicrobium sp. N25]|uniref:DNA-3-methyladenine glycosylase family protein n=1 Tax=Prosthecomicrobium sp. N25 TaxID=3129254 RepID=UPI003076C6CA
MRRIETLDDIQEGIAALAAADPRLVPVIAVAGPVPLRRREPGFEGLARIIVSQQISVSAATAIWNRFAAAVDPVLPEAFLAADPEALRAAGLSAGKVRTLTAIARAVAGREVDLDHVAGCSPEEAHAAMTRIHGVGPWTADIFLLFCAGHPDVWPGGDLALQHAVRMGLGLEERPAEKLCRGIAEPWAPWRSVAARLFWAYYGAVKEGRDVLPA